MVINYCLLRLIILMAFKWIIYFCLVSFKKNKLHCIIGVPCWIYYPAGHVGLFNLSYLPHQPSIHCSLNAELLIA